jgi:hypothetical protein
MAITDPTMLAVPSGLTREEIDFVYHVEVLNMPARAAAGVTGIPLGSITAPHVMEARRKARQAFNDTQGLTKADIVQKMMDAVDRARIISEPMTELVGLEKVAKLLGFAEAEKTNVNITATIEVIRDRARGMSDEELARLVGDANVIDGDFYVVKKDAETPVAR